MNAKSDERVRAVEAIASRLKLMGAGDTTVCGRFHQNSGIVDSMLYKVCYRLQKARRWLLRRRSSGTSKVEIQRFTLWLHPSLEGINEELLLWRTHEPLASRLYSELLREGDHVIDVGANIGYYVAIARQRIGSTGRVIALEPDPRNFELLIKNLGGMVDQISVLQCAAGGHNGEARFYCSAVPNWGSLIRRPELRQSGGIRVQLRTIDDIVSKHSGFRPTVVRMDVEGGELGVLEGAKDTLRVFRPMLFVELHLFIIGQSAVEDLVSDLCDLGYTRGILIDRIWDQPWLPLRLAARHSWTGPLQELVKMARSGVVSLLAV
jgi:FkbM family methyltransferase